MRYLPAVCLILMTGCSYLDQRARDFGDMWRVDVSIGYGLQAHANAGELAHIGVGSSRRYVAGWEYGRDRGQAQTEHCFPLSYFVPLVEGEDVALHSLGVDGDPTQRHRGYMLFPGELHFDSHEKRVVHYLDIEAGFHAGIIGFDFGFSIGEFLDWTLGLFKFSDDWTWMDLGEDDMPDQRKARSIREKRRDEDEGSILIP
ncbi:MAG: hypothetical protein ACYTAF_13310 [Planctomycetota bacterium]|jgi:hypothetical protein